MRGRGRGHVWLGKVVCMAGVAHVAGGMHAWGQAWLGACMACMVGGPCMAGCEDGHALCPPPKKK